jgi:hypothetical protein
MSKECVKQNKGRYISEKRRSPRFPAVPCAGTVKKGVDGNLWESKKMKNGVHRWVKTEKRTSTKEKKPISKKKTVKNTVKSDCVKQVKGRYILESRKSPRFSAESCTGLRRKGADGNFWESKKMESGTSRWVKKSPAKKSPAKKSPAKKSPAKKSPAKKSPAKKSPAKKSPAKKSPTKKSPTKKSPAKKVFIIEGTDSTFSPNKSNLENMTVIQLKALAKKKNYTGYSKLRRDELLDLLVNE